MQPALVCVGDAGINGLATIRSLGRRGVPVDVLALDSSAQIASASRYCRRFMTVPDFSSLGRAILGFDPAVLYVDNDPMMKALAPHAVDLARRFAVVDDLLRAEQLTDKAWQMRVARRAGIPVPKSWFPKSWEELRALRSPKRLIAKPVAGRASFKALIAHSAAKLASALRENGTAPADVLVQEFVEGEDSAIYAGLCYRARSRDQCFVLSVRKLRQTTPGAGVMAVGEVVDAPQVREMTRRLVRAADVHGVLSTEFKLDARDGRYYFIEWNPRPAYFHSIGWKAGFDLPWLAYCDRADPAQLASLPASFSAQHYWINVHADMMNFLKQPRRSAADWAPYLGRKQWAVFALDDLGPSAKALGRLTRWVLRGKSFGRALVRLTARRA